MLKKSLFAERLIQAMLGHYSSTTE